MFLCNLEAESSSLCRDVEVIPSKNEGMDRVLCSLERDGIEKYKDDYAPVSI